MDFEDDIEELKDRKASLEEQVASLESKLAEKSSITEQLREDLRDLKASVEEGEIPEERDGDSEVAGLDPVELNENGNPPRGARSRQIEQAVRLLGRREETFKAAEVFDLLDRADPNFGEQQRAYLYSKLDELRDEGTIEKVKRGTWRLANDAN